MQKSLTIVRASHANEFELQNYSPLAQSLDIRVVTSRQPLTHISLPTTRLWSPTDLPDFPYRRQILNRLIGGGQWLIGMRGIVNKGEILHTAETYTPYTHQAVVLRRRGVISRLICTCWETIPHNNEKFRLLREWKKDAYRYVDMFHTPTKRAKEALVTEGVDPQKIAVIPYGVDIKRFAPLKFRHKNRRPAVLTVARLQKEKGMEVIEKAAAALPNYDFRVIGTGSFIPSRSNITISAVPYGSIHTEYQKADVFFLPSQSTQTWEEQYGMVLVEAMACGVPIVASDSGAIPEVVGNAGIIVRQGDTSGFIQALREIHHSARLRARAVSLYDRNKCSQNLRSLYSSVLFQK